MLSLTLGEDAWRGWRLVLDVNVFDLPPGNEVCAHPRAEKEEQ